MSKPEPYCVVRIYCAGTDCFDSFTERYTVECLGTFDGQDMAAALAESYRHWSDGQIIAVCRTSPYKGLFIYLSFGVAGSRSEWMRALPAGVLTMVSYRCRHWQEIHGTLAAVQPVSPPVAVQLDAESSAQAEGK